jgi:uncharacterized protein
MSELINNALRRKELLKHMILQLHEGHAPTQVRTQLIRLLGQVPYGEVVEVEQELIKDGVPVEEIMRLCDVHTAALQGAIDQAGAKTPPPGHPAHTFAKENEALEWELAAIAKLYQEIAGLGDDASADEQMASVRGHFNSLMDVDKHYRRKEELLFPFLEKHGITGPPKVMWGKHDEARALLKGSQEALMAPGAVTAAEARSVIQLVLEPASRAVADMIDKEQQILLPMCLDTLTDLEWWEVSRGSVEIGFCLYDPPQDPADAWRPAELPAETVPPEGLAGRIQLPSGSFTPAELTAVLNTIPFDLTFVDKDDTVRFFTQGRERIFSRSRAILGRQVQFCHPPRSVHIVEQILGDFRAGRQQRAQFWIELKGRFLSIEYFALRGTAGEYLGCLEVSQDLTEKRALTGQQRLLSYADNHQDRGGTHAE